MSLPAECVQVAGNLNDPLFILPGKRKKMNYLLKVIDILYRNPIYYIVCLNNLGFFDYILRRFNREYHCS